jgi:hypothetical protein
VATATQTHTNFADQKLLGMTKNGIATVIAKNKRRKQMNENLFKLLQGLLKDLRANVEEIASAVKTENEEAIVATSKQIRLNADAIALIAKVAKNEIIEEDENA